MNKMDAIYKKVKKLLEKIPEEAHKRPKIVIEYKLALLACFLEDLINEGLSYVKIGEIFGVSDSTIARFKNTKMKIYKDIWSFVKRENFCDDLSFDTFMLFKLKLLSAQTITKNKFYYNYYKKFYEEEKLNKIKIKRSKPAVDKEYIKTQKQRKLKKSEEYNKIVNSFKPKRKEIKKVHIIATSKSNETIKQLAKDFKCEIKEITDYFKKDQELWHCKPEFY